MKLILKETEPIAWLCSRKSFAVLEYKLARGGGQSGECADAQCVALGPARRLLAASLLVLLALLFLQPVAFAQQRLSPQVYADEANGKTIQIGWLQGCPGLTYTSSASVSHISLSGAPAGLSVTRASRAIYSFVDDGDTYSYWCHLDITLSFTGSVTSDTTVNVNMAHGAIYPLYSGSRNAGSFTIKPTPKGLVTSTPTNSSTVTEAGSQSTFTVKLRKAPSANVTVAVSSDNSTEGSVSPSTMTFTTTNWNTPQTVTVTGVSDSLSDGSVNWNVVLNPASSGDSTYNGLANVNVAMTTTDEPVFSIDSPSVTEGDSSSVTMTFTVTLSALSSTQHTVNYAVSGTATSGTDYTAVTGTMLTFAAGTTSQTIAVSVTGDTVAEGNETVVITLSNASSGTAITTAVGTGTIVDDDLEFSINSPSVTEGDTSSVNLVFTVTLNASVSAQHTVDYAQTGGTASSGTDYTAVTSNTLTFAAGTTSQMITVSVRGDTVDEGASETVVLTLSNASSGTSITTATGTGTITDDDPKFSINSPTVTEGDSSSVNLVFTVTLSASSTSQYTVDYAQTGGTATSGTDYTAVTANTLTFAAGTTTQTITVSVTGDTTDESNETVVITLSNASTGTGIGTATGTGTIRDNDPKFSINSPSVVEGDSGSADLVFTVTLSASSSSQLTVDYARTGGTAMSGTDYTAVASNTLTFAANTTTQTITVSVRGDTVDEGASETVVLTLSNASTGTGIGTATGTGTITDDDPKFSINSPSVTEGDSSSKNMTFTVSLSAAGASQYTVDFADAGTGSATSADYTISTSSPLTFAAGTTSQTITVSVTGDTLDEGASETVVITLSNASAGTAISTASGTGTITDDDPKFSINSPSVTEGDSSSVTMTFTVTLSAAGASQYTVDFADAGTGSATSADYTISTSSPLTFAAGTTTQTITVSVTGDTLNEGNETVVVTLSNASAGTAISTASGTGTIIDNDLAFSINSPSVVEGDSGDSNSLVFTVTLSGSVSTTQTVEYAEGSGTATSGTDYTAVTGGTLTFAANETSKTITVSVTGDATDEANETVVIELSNATTGITTATGTGTITDDDPKFSINSPSVVEGDSGDSNSLVFTVTLSAASSSSLTVNYARTGGTATSGTDYTAVSSGMLTFTGTTTQTITVPVTGDATDEGAGETVVVTLSSPSAGTGISTMSGTGTITDDDPKFSIDSPAVTESDTSSVNMTFTVTLSGAGNSQYTVDYASSDGATNGATAGTDYTAVSGTLTFPAGTTSQTITVSVTGDTMNEANETVVVTLSDPSAGTAISTATGTGTITDNDTPNFSINSPSVAEGDSSTTNLVFTVTLSPAPAATATVNWAEGTGGTATSGTDYTAITGGTLTIAAGATSGTITVVVAGDTTHEADETVVITLSNASTGTNISTASGTGTITNDDSGLTIDSPSVAEGDSGSVNLVFTVTMSPSSSSQVTVAYAFSGTAIGGTDYATISGGTLTFAANDTSETITVSVTGDTINEANETVIVTLSSASGADIVTGTGTGTITDDDTPRFSIDTPSVVEGDSSSASLTFTVTLSPASYQASVTVNWSVTGGTATSGTDYTATSGGMLTFTPTNTSRTFTVSVTGDTNDEGAGETVVATLSNASAGTEIGTASGTGTITDDDPKFSIDSPSVTEGDGGSVNLVFTVTLGASSTSRLTVDYADAGTGTATSGTDYTAVDAGTLTFAAGVTSRTIAVPVTGDTANEANETVVLALSNATGGAGISTASGTGTITDNDTPSFSIDSPSVAEGDSSTTNLVFTVTLSPVSATQVTVNYASSDGTTNGATAGTDYTANTGTLTFAANAASQTITIVVEGDTTYEPDETVIVTLSGASTGTNIATLTGTGTITNDDPGLSIANASVTEGDSGSVNLAFTVTMSPASSSQVTVNYATTATGTATAGTDYTAISSTTLTFAMGETSKTITVSVTGDTVNEPDETVIVMLSSPSGADLVMASATGTIRDNDTPGFSIDSPSVVEGDPGDSTNLVFTVSLSPESYQTSVTVNWAVTSTSSTATSGTDYDGPSGAASGTLTFAAPNKTSQTITMSVMGDLDFEENETVVVTLSGASTGTAIVTASGTGTITNDDPGISIDSPTVEEVDEDETATLTFTVTLEPAPTAPVTVDYADAGTGTAESGVDYTALAAGTLTFAASETSKTILVSVIGDILSEPDETVVVTLSNPNPSYTLVTASGTGTIEDNDELVQDELDMEIVTEVAREVTTSVVTAVSNRVASVAGGAAVAPPVNVPATGGFADGGLLSILAHAVKHDRERDRGLERSEMSLYRSLDDASFVYSPSALGATGASGGGHSGILTVWGSVDYRKMSGSGEGTLTWDGELASLNIGTDTLSESGVLVGVAVGASKGSFGYQGSIGGTSGVLKIRVKTLNPYVGWSLSESASMWASVGYGRGKINYNDEDTESSSGKMKLASAAFGGRYRLFSSDGSGDGRLVQVDLKGEAWGVQNEVEGDERRPMGSKSRSHGMRVAVETHRSGVLESGASLVLSGEAGVRWDGGDGDTGTGFEMGGTANYGNSATGMKVVATTRVLLDHESGRKEWGAGLTVGSRVDGRETGMTYRSSLSHGQAESGVDSLWDSSAASRTSSEEDSLATRLDAEVGYRFYGNSGLHTPYVGFGAEESSKRNYRVGMRYAGGSAISSGLEFERREASSRRPDHRVMLTGRMNW